MLEAIAQALQSIQPGTRIWVAYSGGLDSQVLLHAMVSFAGQYDLAAIHVHHGLSNNADSWAAFCKQTCDSFQVPLEIAYVNATPASGCSPEAAARDARYHAMRQVVAPGEVIVSAHHQYDQAETLLLQLLRGAGVRGAAAMPAQTSFGLTPQPGEALLLRPLLAIARTTLQAYAKQHQLIWIEDESNADVRFDRNFLRHEVLPAIEARWPSAKQTLTRAAENFASVKQLVDDLAEMDLWTIQAGSGRIIVSQLLGLTLGRQINVLSYWLLQQGYQLASKKQLLNFLGQLGAPQDKHPCLRLPVWVMRRYLDELHVHQPLLQHNPDQVLFWDGCSELELPADLGTVAPEVLPRIDLTDLTVRFRRGGERLRLSGRAHSHSLKKLMQLWRVPPWLRDRIPLVFSGESLVVVVGYCNDGFIEDAALADQLDDNPIS